MGWTRNYENLLCSTTTLLNNGAQNSTYAFGDAYHYNVKTPSGTVMEVSTATQDIYGNVMPQFAIKQGTSLQKNTINVIQNPTEISGDTSTKYKYIAFGSGNTAESKEDFNVENIISTISKISDGSSAEINSGGTLTFHLNLTVCSSVDCTVKEFGIYLLGRYKAAYSAPYIMIYRKVLPTPVSLTANQPMTLCMDIVTPAITIA